MKKLIVLGVLAIGAFVGWKVVLQGSPACEVYESFANSALAGAHRQALAQTDGPSFDGMFGSRQAKATFTPPLMEAFHRADYEYESIRKSDDQVDLDVLQTVYYDPPGTHSAIGGTMADRFRHRVTVAKRGAEWKVVRFESTHLGNIAGR